MPFPSADRRVTARPLPFTGSRLTILLMVTMLLGACASSARMQTPAAPQPEPPPAAIEQPQPPPAVPVTLAVPPAVVDGGLDLRAGPVAVPLELEMPSLAVRATVIGVGITATDVMDAPMGPARDPVWQQAFWYRGSAVPGERSTALIAGHVSGPRGRPGVFDRLDRLQPGDPVVVHDVRSGLQVRFSVTGATTISLDQASDAAVLTGIYGSGPVAGTTPQPSPDGLAHLTLITCAGTFRNGTHDRRLVVSATRIG